MNPQSAPGEAAITPQTQQAVVPDVLSTPGKQQLLQHLGNATNEKPILDSILHGLATKIGADFTSRVKNPQTTVQKIAQKRLQGRDYNVFNVNDAYGARIIINNTKDLQKAKAGLESLAKAGAIDIIKQQRVNNDTYSAYHIDIKTPQGTNGEVQIMTPKQELESLANHPLRAVHGEKPNDSVRQLKDKQAKLVKSISNTKASSLSQTIRQMSESNGAQPLDPRIIASVLSK
jgi:ppGpp synthetase/RelA/SpoT-type nucleotidyltranferase